MYKLTTVNILVNLKIMYYLPNDFFLTWDEVGLKWKYILSILSVLDLNS